MKARLFLVVLIGFVAAADEPPVDDKQAIQGTWSVTGFERNGRSGGDTVRAAGLKVTFKGDKITYKVKDKEMQEGTTFKLEAKDPTKSPKSIVTTASGAKGKMVEKGIYKLDGDQLTLCIAEADKDEPKGFETKEGDGLRMFILTRDKEEKKDPDKEKDK